MDYVSRLLGIGAISMPIDRVDILHDEIDIENLKPLDDRILVERLFKDKSSGGIWLSGEIRSECSYGRVLKVGRGIMAQETGKVYPMSIKPGDIVLTMDFAGDKLHTQDRRYKVTRDHGVWAKVRLDKNMNLLDLEPYSSRVLVKVTDKGITQGGIHLPDSHQTRGYTMATVVKVGPGWRDFKTGYVYPMTVKPGDIVCMTRYAGSIVEVDHKELRLIEERPYMASDKQPDILFVHNDWKGWENGG